MCPPTLLVGSGWDFIRVGQGTGDLHPIVNDGVIDDQAENAPQRIRCQLGERGYGDFNLEETCRKGRRGIKGDTRWEITSNGLIEPQTLKI